MACYGGKFVGVVIVVVAAGSLAVPRTAGALTPCLPQQLCLLVFVCMLFFISHFLCTFSTVITSFYIIFHTPEEEEGTHQTTRRRSRPRCRRAAPPAHF